MSDKVIPAKPEQIGAKLVNDEAKRVPRDVE